MSSSAYMRAQGAAISRAEGDGQGVVVYKQQSGPSMLDVELKTMVRDIRRTLGVMPKPASTPATDKAPIPPELDLGPGEQTDH